MDQKKMPAALRMAAVSEPFCGVPIVLAGIMQGVGKAMAAWAIKPA